MMWVIRVTMYLISTHAQVIERPRAGFTAEGQGDPLLRPRQAGGSVGMGRFEGRQRFNKGLARTQPIRTAKPLEMEFQLDRHCHPRKIQYPPTIAAVPPRGRGCAGRADDGGLGGMRDEMHVTVLDGGGLKPKTG